MPSELPPLYRSPIDLPEGKIGKFEVKHKYEVEHALVRIRESLFTGKPAEHIVLDKPIRLHYLYEDDELWIADMPQEVRQHREAIERMRPLGPKVLVGGLGLGIMAALLAEEPTVRQIDVVEISPEVAKLCKPKSAKVHLHVEDIAQFLKDADDWIWTAAFMDVWRGDGEGTWWEDIFPLRRLIGQRFGARANMATQYWAEDIMMGQVGHALIRRNPSTRPHWYYKEGLKLPMTVARARKFIHEAGTPAWEKRYGGLYG